MIAIIGKLVDVSRFMAEADLSSNTSYPLHDESYSWERNVAWLDAQIALENQFQLVSDNISGRLADEVAYLIGKDVPVLYDCELCGCLQPISTSPIDVFCSVCRLVIA